MEKRIEVRYFYCLVLKSGIHLALLSSLDESYSLQVCQTERQSSADQQNAWNPDFLQRLLLHCYSLLELG